MSDDPQASGGGLDPVDRDAMIRTVMTEAATPDGWGAVANTIKNRLATGKFGATPAAVVTAPNQFEVWSDGSAQKVDPSSPQYAAAGRVVDAVAAGQAPDNTNGATHFFSPTGQAARAGDGRQQTPDWAVSPTASVAGNVFFAPQGRVTYQQPPAGGAPAAPPITFGGQQNAPDPGPAPAAAAPSQPPASATPAPAVDPSTAATFARWGVGSSGAASSATPTATAAPDASTSATFARWGVPQQAAASTTASTAQPTVPISFGSPDATAAPTPQGAAAPTNNAAAAAVTGAIGGVPIVGPYALGGMERLSAFQRSMDNGTPYADELKTVQAADAARAADNPTATTAGKVGGAVLGMAPALAAAPGLLGAAGTTGSRIVMGGLSGAAIGGTDAAVRGESPAVGAGLGAAGGVLGPLAGNAAGKVLSVVGGKAVDGGNALLNLMRDGTASGLPGYSKAATNVLTQAAQYDGGAENLLTQARRLGPLATMADVGPSMQGLALGATKTPSEARSAVVNAFQDRAAGSDDRVMNALGATFGPDRDPALIAQGIGDARSAAAGPAYTALHASAPPVDVTNVVQGIDGQLATATGAQRKALTNIRSELVAIPVSVDPATGAEIPESYVTDSRILHNVRQDIDAAVNKGDDTLGVGQSAVLRNNGSLTAVRGALDSALKTQVPGMADADTAFAHSADVQNGIARGYDEVLGAQGPHPDSFTTERAGMDPDVAAAQNVGIAGRVYRTFGTGTQRDAVKLNKLLASGEDGYAAKNLSTAFGDEPVSNLLDTVAREKTFADTTNKIVQNSVTARVQGGANMLEAAQPGSTNLTSASLTGLGLQAGKSMLLDPLLKAAFSSPDAPVAMEVVRALTAQGATRDEILAQLGRLGGQQGALSATSNALLMAGNRGGQALTAGSGETNRPDTTLNALGARLSY